MMASLCGPVKKGMLSLGAPAAVEEAGGFITLWTVERQRPFVHTSYRSPMLTTKALGRGSTGCHSPEARRTCRGHAIAGGGRGERGPGEETVRVAFTEHQQSSHGPSRMPISCMPRPRAACLQATSIHVADVGLVLMEDCEAGVVGMLAVAHG